MGLFDKKKEAEAAKKAIKKKKQAKEKIVPPKVDPEQPAPESTEEYQPKIFFSKRAGLKIILDPMNKTVHKGESPDIKMGSYIQFKENKYWTRCLEEEEYLTEYAESHPGDVFVTNPKQTKLLKAIAQVRAEEGAGKRTGKQGAVS